MMLREIFVPKWQGFIIFSVGILAFCLLLGGSAQAQDLSGLSPSQIQQLMQNLSPEQQQKLQQGQAQQTAPSSPVVLKPSGSTKRSSARSRIEQGMSSRAGVALRQFGYDQVGAGRSISVPQMGALQDSYVLGPGDEVDVTLRGQENSQFSVTVDRNGQVVLPRLAPLGAAGRTLGDFRRALQDAVHRAYVSTEANVAIGQLRQATVLVSGEVNNPGTQIVTASSTALDAVLLSGGIRKSGTLRDIKLIRGGKAITVDLYGVLTRQGSAKLPNLQDGDRILVPPIGTVVGISGYVRRPGIYELPAGQTAITADTLMALGNGLQQRGEMRDSIARIMPDGKVQFVDVTGQRNAALRDGEVLIVAPTVNKSEGRVTLAGAVRTPGVFSVDRFRTLRDLLPSSDAFQNGAYLLFGFIDRIDQTTLQHTALVYSPLRVAQGKENLELASDDKVYVLTVGGVRALLRGRNLEKPKDQAQQDQGEDQGLDQGKGQEQDLTGDQGNDTTDQGSTSEQLANPAPGNPVGAATGGAAANAQSAVGAGGDASGSAAASSGADASAGTAGADAADAGDDAAAAGGVFGKKLTDYRFTVSGAVQKPGTYLAAPNTTLAEAVQVFNGLTQDADLSNFELTSTVMDNANGVSETQRHYYPATPDQFQKIVLNPYDAIKFRTVFSDRDSGSVRLGGEVRYPGTYPILRGEKLSSVLMRAGGLTEVAYPYGTVFLRQSTAKREAEVNKKLIADVRSQLFTVLLHPASSASTQTSPESVAALQGLLTQMANTQTLGRIAVVADPGTLAAHPEGDPLLQPGDRITIPKIPFSVSVLGEVMQPGSLPARKSWSAQDYIDAAGGFSQFADESRVIVVLPDGRAYAANQGSWLNFDSDRPIPPGSAIVISRDVSSLSGHQFVVDTTQIFSALATTAAALAVLARY